MLRILFHLCKLLALALLLASCAAPPYQGAQQTLAVYTPATTSSRLEQFTPLFVVEQYNELYNRIGTARAIESGPANERVFIDPSQATIYGEERSWSGQHGTYTNLLYRIHFQEIPFSLLPFHLGAGSNIGLFVIITLDAKDRPLLYTTLHTCGCYLSFTPTSYLADESYPPGWDKGRHNVYGESLPGLLRLNDTLPEQNLTLVIRKATHRVKDISLTSASELSGYHHYLSRLLPLAALEQIPLGSGASTSFYETAGERVDYVKGSQKVWERLLISWWAFDWRVGEDKKLGRSKKEGITFYTSLKPWARKQSDLRDFAAFLRYWQWQL